MRFVNAELERWSQLGHVTDPMSWYRRISWQFLSSIESTSGPSLIPISLLDCVAGSLPSRIPLPLERDSESLISSRWTFETQSESSGERACFICRERVRRLDVGALSIGPVLKIERGRAWWLPSLSGLVGQNSRRLLLHSQEVGHIEAEVVLRECALKLEGMLPFLERLKHHIDAIIDAEIGSGMDVRFTDCNK